MGTWSVELKGGDGVLYSGILNITRRTGDGIYKGYMEIQFQSGRGTGYSAVYEDAMIVVNGDTVFVYGAKPVVLTEDVDYIPDSFLLTQVSPNVLEGVEKDYQSIGGTVTLTRKK